MPGKAPRLSKDRIRGKGKRMAPKGGLARARRDKRLGKKRKIYDE